MLLKDSLKIGDRCGYIVIIEGPISKSQRKKSQKSWLCKCDCGNSKEILDHVLRRGRKSSCGCKKKIQEINPGDKFGYVTVIEFIKNPGNIPKFKNWKCLCDCGEYKNFRRNELYKKTYCSHDCLLINKFKSGDKIELLTVLEYIGKNNDGRRSYKCICDCGKITIKIQTDLINGRYKSCGCLRQDIILDQEYGYLKVIEKDKELSKKKNISYWKCVCVCGNYKSVSSQYLYGKSKKNCGCISYSTKFKDIYMSYWSAVISGAKSRNLDFNITREQVWELYEKQNYKCALTNLEITFKRFANNTVTQTASIDRIDSNKGYTLDNIQIIHKDLNRMKNDFSQVRFVELCKLVSIKLGE